jgi:soluble lytic murein transglycosylase-like protein
MAVTNSQSLRTAYDDFSKATQKNPTAATVVPKLQTLQSTLQATDGIDPTAKAKLTTELCDLLGDTADPNFATSAEWKADLAKFASDIAAVTGGKAPGASPGSPPPQPHGAGGDAASSATSNPPTPMTGPMASQWQGMVQSEIAGLKNEAQTTPTITANYAQAGIKAPVSSALPPSNPEDILKDPLAKAAQAKMQENYPATGSMDLTEAQIKEVYGPAITAASKKTGVPEDMITSMIWTESKGHPLTSNGGLVQIDPVAWGQMADKDPSLKNRYNPAENIMAGAAYLASKAGGSPPTSPEGWKSLYHAQYQG